MKPSLTNFGQHKGQIIWGITIYLFEPVSTPEPIEMSWDLDAVIDMQINRQVEEALKDEP